MQPKLLLPPIASHGLITVTISSWAHPVLSSNLSKKFKTLLQDSSSLHLVITTLHFSCKSCTSFPFQSALNTKLHTCASMLWTLPVLLTSLNSYISTLRLHASFFFRIRHAQNPAIQTQDFWLSHFYLLWTLCLEFTSTRHQTLLNCSTF